MLQILPDINLRGIKPVLSADETVLSTGYWSGYLGKIHSSTPSTRISRGRRPRSCLCWLWIMAKLQVGMDWDGWMTDIRPGAKGERQDNQSPPPASLRSLLTA